MESRVSIGWRVGVSIGWRGGVSIQWRGASPLDGEVGSPLDGDLQVDCRVVGGCLRQVKTSSPGPFGASPVFAMWQNRSDQFCHFSALKRREKHFPDHSPCVLTKARYITAECITRQNCAFTKIRLALWGGFWYSNRVLRIGLENPFQGGCNVYAGRDTREAG